MPSDNALERLSRILDLIPYLATREASTNEVASLMGVDVADLERDLEIAFLCGLPGYTPDLLIDLTVEDGVVSVSNPQGLKRPRRITTMEAASLLVGLELIEYNFAASSIVREACLSLRDRLKLSVDHPIDVDQKDVQKISEIESALLSGSRITFDYVDTVGRNSETRSISPWKLIHRKNRSLLRGYDHDRGEPREFLLSAMQHVTMTEGEARPEPTVARSNESLPYEAFATFHNLPNWWLRRHALFVSGIDRDGDEVQVQLRFWNLEWLSRALIAVADQLISVQSNDFTEEEIRSLMLSHFSG